MSELEHGTRNSYVYHRCRCEPCTKANREYQRRYMREVYAPKHRERIREQAREGYIARTFREGLT